LTLKNVRAGHLSFLVEKPTTQQEIVILDKHCQANNIAACTNRKCFCLRDSAISCKVAGTQDQHHSVGDAPPCILYGCIQSESFLGYVGVTGEPPNIKVRRICSGIRLWNRCNFLSNPSSSI
jgi:hypothetical protein